MSMTKKGESAKATQDVEEPKKLETLQDYKDAGWEVGPNVKMSYPPVYTLTKGDETIQFRPKMKNAPKFSRKEAKGGMINKYAGGGMVKGYRKGGSVKNKKAGRLAKRGYGICKK